MGLEVTFGFNVDAIAKIGLVRPDCFEKAIGLNHCQGTSVIQINNQVNVHTDNYCSVYATVFRQSLCNCI